MKTFLLAALVFMSLPISSQGFECDGSMYIVIYTQSVGRSVLYRITIDDGSILYEPISLSEDRRLTSLAYNVLDKHLYAIDVDTREFIRIASSGELVSLGVPENLDPAIQYNSATISPDGSGIFMIGYDQSQMKDTRFYTINLSRENFYSGFLGVTGENSWEIHDFATDPLTGIMYGYDNRGGYLVQIGIGGQISSLSYPATGVQNIDGVFFDDQGQLYGYAAQRGLYLIDKLDGTLQFYRQGPEGTHGDGCSCPYTYSFTKEIIPQQILPCQDFEVEYTFQNNLGIGQTWLDIRDTFPEGFEIIDVQGGVVSDFNIMRDQNTNILALENIIFLMGTNSIQVTVRPASTFFGEFESQAVIWDFPAAFGHFVFSDDPITSGGPDPSKGSIISENDLDFTGLTQFDCSGEFVEIMAPFQANTYNWSTGSNDPSILVDEEGWYSLEASGDCIYFFDSIQISGFPEPSILKINGPASMVLGETKEFTADLSQGIIGNWDWESSGALLDCSDCEAIQLTPFEDATIILTATDEDGCEYQAELFIEVEERRDFYAPNAFSPNDDGINDYFFLQSSVPGIIRSLQVYNRWGSEVYSAQDISLNELQSGWNGKTGNRTVGSGVYIWIANIEYFDGVLENHSGEVTLLDHN